MTRGQDNLRDDIVLSNPPNSKFYLFFFKETTTEKTYRINKRITAPLVRVITSEGKQLDIMPIEEALSLAEKSELDLVEVSVTKEISICKIMDYGKFKYRQIKHQHEAKQKQKQKQVQIKEIKIRPQTDDGDYQTKLRNIIRFLEEGNKTKISLRFRGREIAHQELGMRMMDRIKMDSSAYATVESPAKMEGRRIIMILMPIAKTKSEKSTKAP